MAELAMYVGLAGIFIGIGMIFYPMVILLIGKQCKHSDIWIEIGFLIFFIFIFVVIGVAFCGSELGKNIIDILSEAIEEKVK